VTQSPSPPSAAPPAKFRVLVVDDDSGVRGTLHGLLTQLGFEVQVAAGGGEGLKALGQDVYDLVLLDLEMPQMGGLEVLGLAPGLQPDAQFIILTGRGSVTSAVEAIKLGAFDYLSKPPRAADLQLVLQRAIVDRDRRRELVRLRQAVKESGGPTMIGESPSMRRLREELARVAPTRAAVLISGETGTGKELVAQTIHALSDRAGKPFVPVNCSALPEGVLESELFGHIRGAFTGAIANRRGRFEEAGEGTVFLDEVGTLSKAVQVKLLRVLQEHRIERVGGGQPVTVSFRLVAATNVDFGAEVAAGRFREDLYFRLNVVPVRVPPLRERGEDILLLAGYFRARFAEEYGIASPEFSPALVRRLLKFDWPGNVRQLENFVQRAVIMHSGHRAIPALPLEDPAGETPEAAMVNEAAEEAWDLARVEREYILLLLDRHHGQLARTAEALGIDRRTLYRRLKEYAAAGHLAAVPAM
jgi:DNA-binding NtrC family response regulator